MDKKITKKIMSKLNKRQNIPNDVWKSINEKVELKIKDTITERDRDIDDMKAAHASELENNLFIWDLDINFIKEAYKEYLIQDYLKGQKNENK